MHFILFVSYVHYTNRDVNVFFLSFQVSGVVQVTGGGQVSQDGRTVFGQVINKNQKNTSSDLWEDCVFI